MTVDTTAALARVAAAQGAGDEAARALPRDPRALGGAATTTTTPSAGIRWGAAFFAAQGDRDGAHACAEALTRIASETGHADALAALAHAIAEIALLEGDPDTAAEQLARAVELHRGLDMPFERAQIEHRAGVALAAAGERELGLERLCDAYRTARKLGARPLASEVAREVAALGESVVVRLGARAAADADGGGLSRREREVVRLLAVGRTNREIAQELFLSPRTVDMHVRNILRKLDCRSRVEAAGRARELGLTAPRSGARRGALAAGVAGVRRPLRLDQQHLRVLRLRAVLDAARHDESSPADSSTSRSRSWIVSWPERRGRSRRCRRACARRTRRGLHDGELVVVERADDPGLERGVEQRELLGEVDLGLHRPKPARLYGLLSRWAGIVAATIVVSVAAAAVGLPSAALFAALFVGIAYALLFGDAHPLTPPEAGADLRAGRDRGRARRAADERHAVGRRRRLAADRGRSPSRRC